MAIAGYVFCNRPVMKATVAELMKMKQYVSLKPRRPGRYLVLEIWLENLQILQHGVENTFSVEWNSLKSGYSDLAKNQETGKENEKPHQQELSLNTITHQDDTTENSYYEVDSL